jgi:DNA-binding beta-propeller fold protein YncE
MRHMIRMVVVGALGAASVAPRSEVHAQVPALPGTVLVTNKAPATATIIDAASGATVTELDLATGRVMRSIDVPEQPEAINITPDGSEVWVGSNGTGKVSVVDTYMGSVVTAAEGFRWPYRVLFTPDAETVLLPDYTGDALRFVTRRTRKELGRLDFPQGGPQGITVTSDGRYALLSLSREARVAVIDIASRTVVGYVPAGETPDGVVFTSRVTR